MKSQFTEFSYGFALTHGLLKDTPSIRVVPHFPSLVEEGDVGYDAKINYPGLPLFLQFKLSDYLTRRPAKYWDYYHKPYYRFDITPRRRSRQHNLLKRLYDKGNYVFYVAPLFSEISEFDRAFTQNKVADRSIWLPLERLPRLTDDDPHHVTFTGSSSPSWHTEHWNLEGTLVEGEFSWEQVYDDIVGRFERHDLREISRNYLYELREVLFDILNRRIPEGTRASNLQVDDLDVVLGEIGYLLTTYFGVEMVVLRPAQPSSG